MLGAVKASPQLQFPCPYPIKVLARSGAELRAALDAILTRHAGPGALASVSERPSAQANYVGVTYVIQAVSEAQIAALFADLKACPAVVMVL
jgi:putative lipoic acid-binding regulatory protein